MPKPQNFEEQYPTIHRFVEEIGWIEIGQHEMISAFVRAYELGGTVYEGEDSSQPGSRTPGSRNRHQSLSRRAWYLALQGVLQVGVNLGGMLMVQCDRAHVLKC